jgi:hypothetical protein
LLSLSSGQIHSAHDAPLSLSHAAIFIRRDKLSHLTDVMPLSHDLGGSRALSLPLSSRLLHGGCQRNFRDEFAFQRP